jgi:hypothetical protein
MRSAQISDVKRLLSKKNKKKSWPKFKIENKFLIFFQKSDFFSGENTVFLFKLGTVSLGLQEKFCLCFFL